MILTRHYRIRLFPFSVIIVCLILLIYFYWFNVYTSTTQSHLNLVIRPNSTSTSSTSSSKTRSPVLLVSAFYPLPKSKHTDDEYREWLSHFLGHIDTDIYFFTTPALEPLVRAARANITQSSSPHTLTINTTFSSPLAIPPLIPHQDKYTQMHTWDRERARHAPQLYAVWNAKPWFLSQGLQNSQRTYKYAFWTDAGSFRHTHAYRAWPDPARVDSIWAHAGKRMNLERPPPSSPTTAPNPTLTPEDLIFFPIFEVPLWSPALASWTLPAGPIDLDIDISQGSFFGGAPKALAWYTRAFYAYHDYYISTRPVVDSPRHPHAPLGEEEGGPPFHFVGKDQTLINAIFMMHPERFFTVIAPTRFSLLPPSSLSPTPLPFPPLPSPSPSPNTPSPNTPPPTPRPPPNSPSALKPLLLKGTNKFWSALRGGAGGVCGDEWFYYQFWVAGRAERGGMRGVWERGGRAGGFWRWVEGGVRGWGEGEGEGGGDGDGDGERLGEGQREGGCGVMPVVSVESILRGVLGWGWEVPKGLALEVELDP